MGCSAKKAPLIIYTMQACVLGNMGFQNMDHPIQTAAWLQNTIWAAYNQGGSAEDGVCRKTEKWRRHSSSKKTGRDATEDATKDATCNVSIQGSTSNFTM